MSRPVLSALLGGCLASLFVAPLAAQPPAPARGGVVPQAAAAARAPFQLNPSERQFVDQVLTTWEQQTKRINTFKVKFEQWKYVPAMGFKAHPQQKNKGELNFAKPDKGSFEITEVQRFKAQDERATWVPDKDEVGEHWVCDGKAVYQYDHRAKELKVLPIAKELQGKAIANGPLPFLFGAEAKKIQQRYWVRVTQSNQQEIWLDVHPKLQADAANHRRVEVILDRSRLLPLAMQVDIPGGDRDVYLFELKDARINHPLDRLLPFRPPSTPFGWKKKVIEAPQAAQRPAGSRGAARFAPQRLSVRR